MTVVKVSAVCVLCISTDILTDLAYWCYYLPDLHAPFQRWRCNHLLSLRRSAWFSRIIKDLMVDRTAYDKIMQAGGFYQCTYRSSSRCKYYSDSEAVADEAMDAASCIGCGACVAACKNGSAMLFVSAKVSQLNLLPQGKPEALRRAKAMLSKMDELGFGNCTNTRACEAECPKCVSISNIARLNRDFIKAKLKD